MLSLKNVFPGCYLQSPMSLFLEKQKAIATNQERCATRTVDIFHYINGGSSRSSVALASVCHLLRMSEVPFLPGAQKSFQFVTSPVAKQPSFTSFIYGCIQRHSIFHIFHRFTDFFSH